MKSPAKLFPNIAYILFLLVSLLLPIFSFDGYSIISNTTSHLGAQGSPNAWIMNLTFIILALTTLWIVLSTKVRFHQVFGFIFSLSLLITGLFRHGSLIEGYPSNLVFDQLHSIFATTTGISFVILSLGHGFTSQGKQKTIGFLLAFGATLLSFAMMALPAYMGIFQRLMFILAFAWLFFAMKAPINMQYTKTQKEKS